MGEDTALSDQQGIFGRVLSKLLRSGKIGFERLEITVVYPDQT